MLYTYSAGTSTPLATYSNSTLTTANANPVVMNAAGRPTTGYIFLSATSYKFEFQSAAGVVLWTVDNASAIPTTATSLDVTGTAGEALTAGDAVYLSDGSGSLNAGRWYKADADNTYSSSTAGMAGVAPDAIASGASGSIRLSGRVTGLSGLTTGSRYYASATAGGLTATPPTNARFLGMAASATILILQGNPGAVRLPDSAGDHALVLRTSENLTADRLLTWVPSDGARTITIYGDTVLPETLGTPGGRLTLTSNTPVTTGDVTAATTLYYTPYKGNRIALLDSNNAWNVRAFSQLSIAVPATTATMYDVFVYDNSGTATLELTAWTNDTTRATGIEYHSGVYVKTGTITRRYVGSFRTTGVSGQTEDSFANRFVWNYYNRVPRPMRVLEDTDSWAYTTNTTRQANASTANQLSFVVGVAEVELVAEVMAILSNTGANVNTMTSIGLDSTTVTATGTVFGEVPTQIAGGYRQQQTATLRTFPAVGYHYAAWLERSEATGTTTWIGDAGDAARQHTGIKGSIEG